MPPEANQFERLRAGDTVVVPSRRVSLALRAHFDYCMLQRGAASWPAPDVIPWDAWLRRQHADLCLREPAALGVDFVLSAAQERALWAQVIAESGEGEGAAAEQLASLAADAWATLQGWRMAPAQVFSGPLSRELAAFRAWLDAYTRRCRELSAGDRHHLLARLPAVTDPRLHFCGFTRLPPAVARVMGTGIRALPPGAHAAAPLPCLRYPSVADEQFAAIHWGRARRAEAPQACVAIACADPREIAALAGGYERLLAAGARGLAGVLAARPYRAGGAALPQVPVIRAALLVQTALAGLECRDCGDFLTNPYLAGAAPEAPARARLAAALLGAHVADLPLARLQSAADAADPPCPVLASALRDLLRLVRAAPRRQPLRGWMAHFEQCLAGIGWPGDLELAPQEQAAVQHWQQALDTTAALDSVLPPVSAAGALSRLRATLQRRRFVAPAIPGAIEILSIPEAVALGPEFVWVSGLVDTAWPPKIEANPLLPYALLRRAGVPGADGAGDLNTAAALLAALVCAAHTVVFSHTALNGDTPQRASPLLGAAEIRQPAPDAGHEAWRTATTGLSLEPWPDDHGPPLPAGATTGGAAILTDQAACPFKAFARHRLGAATIEAAAPGLDAPARGSLVHRVLAEFWLRVPSQAAAAALSPQALAEAIDAAVERACAAVLDGPPAGTPFWRLERERLRQLLAQWLVEDLARAPFAVEGCEVPRRLALGGIEINLRIDRIDRLTDGSLFILDYKTGRDARKPWTIPRPDQPQLPLYVLAEAPAPVRGIAFAYVRTGDCKLAETPPGVSQALDTEVFAPDWTATVGAWREELTRLAAAYAAGFAAVDPKDGAQTCRRCDLQVLCRVYEQGLATELEAAADE